MRDPKKIKSNSFPRSVQFRPSLCDSTVQPKHFDGFQISRNVSKLLVHIISTTAFSSKEYLNVFLALFRKRFNILKMNEKSGEAWGKNVTKIDGLYLTRKITSCQIFIHL